MNIFYVYADATTTGAQAQVNAFKRAGFDIKKSDCMVDLNGSREDRDWLCRPKGEPPFPGWTVRLACAAYIGKPGKERAKVLRALASRGILVAVLDEDPILYDDDAKIAKFLKEAEAVARSDNGKKSGGAGKGRPPTVAWLTGKQWRDLLVSYRKSDPADPEYVTRPAFKAIVAMHSTNNGLAREREDITDDWLIWSFGKRKDRDDRRPPKQLLPD